MTDGFAIHETARDTASHAKPRHLSHLLLQLSVSSGPKVSIRDIAIAMEDRSFGAFLVVFALPNLIPLPPGATFILGLPLIFIAWQMFVSSRTRVWFPERIASYAFDKASFSLIVTRISPWLMRAEKLVKPRAWFLTNRTAERLLGFFALVLAVVVFLPIPLGNWLPAFALAIIGFAHSERDGLGLIVGGIVGIVSLAVAGLVLFTAGALLSFVF